MRTFFRSLTGAQDVIEPAGFTPVNELERLLLQTTHAPGRMAFMKALGGADIFAAMKGASRPVEEWKSLRSGEQIALFNVAAPDGGTAIAAFTSPDQLFRRFGYEAAVLQITGGDFLKLVAASGAYLNPGAPHSIYWSPRQIAVILGQPPTMEMT